MIRSSLQNAHLSIVQGLVEQAFDSTFLGTDDLGSFLLLVVLFVTAALSLLSAGVAASITLTSVPVRAKAEMAGAKKAGEMRGEAVHPASLLVVSL